MTKFHIVVNIVVVVPDVECTEQGKQRAAWTGFLIRDGEISGGGWYWL